MILSVILVWMELAETWGYALCLDVDEKKRYVRLEFLFNLA